MRNANFTVFDEYIPATTNTSSAAVLTPTQHNAQLGKHNQLAAHVIIDNITATAASTFLLFVEHSADGRNWIQRSNQSSGAFASGDADIQISLTSTSTLAQGMWSDSHDSYSRTTTATTPNYTGPLLGFVRFRMFFTLAANAAHVRVHATQREA